MTWRLLLRVVLAILPLGAMAGFATSVALCVGHTSGPEGTWTVIDGIDGVVLPGSVGRVLHQTAFVLVWLLVPVASAVVCRVLTILRPEREPPRTTVNRSRARPRGSADDDGV
jgi:hypothetical protein